MPGDPPRPTLRSLEPEVRRLWAARRLPAKGGVVGRGDGPRVRQIEGTFVPGDAPVLVAHRAVLADVDARYLSLSGRNAIGTLRLEAGGSGPPSPLVGPLLESLGVWTGGAGEHPWDDSDQRRAIQSVVARLAHRGILVGRDGPLRICLTCRAPRTPARIIYQKEIGDTYLVRFPLAGTDPPVEALVWVDAPWRLLGASALLVHPDLTYVVAEYRRRGASVTILVSRGALDRLRAWLSDAELVVREEGPGRDWVGRAYIYPLRHEFPIGGSLDPPAGTIQADTGVGDSGTGVVPLVPGHGPTDADIAARLGIAGWPLLTPRGTLDASLIHKYAGLDLETANEFVSRDLTDGGAVLARLRVVRGVPYCSICGHRIVWAPGRAWCLEPGNLPPDQRERYARLLPHERPIAQIEVSRWPISETLPTHDLTAPTLLECARCERLDAPDAPRPCPCGGTRRAVARHLLPDMAGALGAWCRNEPIAPTDIVRIYANEQRRVPTLVHQLTAMTGVDAATADFGLTRVPTVSRIDLPLLIEKHGADAVRSAFVRTSSGDGDTANFEQRCLQEQERLVRLYQGALDALAPCDAALVREGAQPPDKAARDLEDEDRAVLARWARAHLQVFAAYDRWDAAAAHRRLFRFLEQDLLRYLDLVRPRLRLAGTPATKRAALRTLLYLVRSTAVALAPIAPFTSEAIHRRFLQEPRSLFEGVDLVADRSLVDDTAAAAWDRWLAVVQSLDRFRHAHGLAPGSTVGAAVATVVDEEMAERLRADRPTIERLARVGRFDVTSPKVPWEGRRRQVVPVEREIQRAYPALATQIIHLLQHLPPRPGAETTAKSLTVFVSGAPHTITPEMVSTVDTLPENFVPTPFALGEMFVQISGAAPGEVDPPPLSPDAFWLVRRVAHRLAAARAADDETYRVAIAVAVDPLASELREKAERIARYLGIEELRVEEEVAESTPPNRVTGRTRTGARWWVAVPGLHGHVRPTKLRAARSDGRRVRPPTPPPPSDEIDFADEEVVAQAQAIRGLGQELDTLFGAPILGPSKILIAWEAGLQSIPQFREAPFDQVAALPGYGRPVVATLWTKLGMPVPAVPRRAHVLDRGPSAAPAPPRAARRAERKRTGPPEPPTVPRPAAGLAARERIVPVTAPAAAPAPPKEAAPPLPPASPPEVTPVPTVPPPVDLEPASPPPVPAQPGPPEVAPSEQEAVVAEVVEERLPTLDRSGSELPPAPPAPEAGEPPGEVPEAAAEAEAVPEEPVAPAFVGSDATALEPVSPPVEPVPESVPPPEPLSAEEPVAEMPEPPVVAPSMETVPETGASPVPDEPGPAPEVPPSPATEPEGETAPTGPGPEAEAVPSEPPVLSGPPSPEEEGIVEEPGVGPTEAASPLPPDEPTETVASGSPAEPASVVLPPEPTPESVPAEPATVPPQETAPTEAPAPELPVETTRSPEVPADVPPGPPAVPVTEQALAVRERSEPMPRPEQTLPATRPEPTLVVPVRESEPSPAAPEPPRTTLAPPAEVPAPPAVLAPPPPVPAEEAAAAPVRPPAPPSGIEFGTSPTLFGALQPFLDATAAGHRGLAIVRELPERIRTHVGPRPVEVLWLSNLERNRTLRPSDLGEIARRIERAMDDEGVTAIFLEGIEYLVRIHGVDRVVEFLRTIDRSARSHDARIWVHVTPGLLPESDLDRIRTGVSGNDGEAEPPSGDGSGDPARSEMQ